VASYLNRHYTKPSSVIAAAGAVDHARIVEAAATKFSGMSIVERAAPAPASYRGGEARLKRKLEQTHVVIGFEAPSFRDPATYAAHVFANAVGGGGSSRLFQEVREKRGLAYSIYSFHWGYSDTGLFGFHASSAHGDVTELVDVALDCLAECAENLNDAETRRASAAMKLSLLTALESPSSRADQIARQVQAFGRVFSRLEIIEKIDRLTLEDIRSAGRLALRSPPTVSVVGETRRAPDAVKVRERLKGI
jgi:predicted Zn-dependent peptidase